MENGQELQPSRMFKNVFKGERQLARTSRVTSDDGLQWRWDATSDDGGGVWNSQIMGPNLDVASRQPGFFDLGRVPMGNMGRGSEGDKIQWLVEGTSSYMMH